MRRIALFLAVAGMAGAQAMVEYGAAAAGGTVGGASGKAVSDGISNIFGKVNQTVKAAGKETPPAAKQAPALTVATGVTRDVDTVVPAPPPGTGRFAEPRQAPTVPVALNVAGPVPFNPSSMADALPSSPIPPPPTMTPDALKQVMVGMRRADVLKLGDPSSRIAMIEDGHMVETFSYRADGQRFGLVRLQDGEVAKIDTK